MSLRKDATKKVSHQHGLGQAEDKYTGHDVVDTKRGYDPREMHDWLPARRKAA